MDRAPAQLLATATFTNETATGWQEVRFASPVDDHGEHDLRRLLPRADAATTRATSTTSPSRRRQRPAARAARRRGRRQRRLRLRAERHVPDRRLALRELLGRRRVRDRRGRPGHDRAAGHRRHPGPRRRPASAASDNVTATFSEALTASTVNANTVLLRDPAGATVPAAVTYDAAGQTATLDPTAALAASTTYTATVKGGTAGVKDLAGNALAADDSWTFTTRAASQFGCPCSIWGSAATPARPAETTDSNAVEVGTRFRAEADGLITGIRFYKGATNTGTHVGHLWTNTGQLLATATFTNETATGWQQVTLRRAGGDHRQHDVRRLLPRAERQLRQQRRPVRDRRRRQPAAARAARRRGRRQRRLRLRAERHVPDRDLPLRGLLGGRRLRDRLGARHDGADRHRAPARARRRRRARRRQRRPRASASR